MKEPLCWVQRDTRLQELMRDRVVLGGIRLIDNSSLFAWWVNGTTLYGEVKGIRAARAMVNEQVRRNGRG